ncbi:hypothetical protein CPB83DRAFT_902921 [Crepidotus variabilis]|uniref:Uncharacterized protein n=1 Tax=Crepidotus variabilis TaxID=179855 RepID=A0A9P6EQK2_9AGAR|nr:hypothetical protein CPB83DRAFT_902921 [Crepidotus variabilis]
MHFTNVFTTLLLAGSCISSTFAILPYHTRKNLPASRYKNVGTSSTFLRYRDIAEIVDQVLVERGIAVYDDSPVYMRDLGDWDEEDLFERMETSGQGPPPPGGNGRGDGNKRKAENQKGQGGRKTPPPVDPGRTPNNSPTNQRRA